MSDIPIFEPEDFAEGFEAFEKDHSYLFERRTDEAMQAHRERPYFGQAHTDFGQRGMTQVSGVTMRDVGDCIARAFAQSIPPETGIDGMDWTALIQNTLCNVEKMMGIFPNIEPKEPRDD